MTIATHGAGRVFAGVAACLTALGAHAHDSWLIPDRCVLSAPGAVSLAFVTSESFPGRDATTSPERIASFVLVRAGVSAAVTDTAREADALVARADPATPGVYTAALALRPRFIELDARQFNQYLTEERANAAIATRRTSPGDRPGLELYTKLAKTFIEVSPGVNGAAEESNYTSPVGHTLEIVPLSNPCRWKTGEKVSVRALLDGEPAQGLFVSSGAEGGAEHGYEATVRTDANGVASFTFSRPGLWFLRTHVIRPLKATPETAQGVPEGKAPEWESFFASMTFRVNEK